MPTSKAVLQAIAVTAELTGAQFSPAAARVFADDLSRYPEHQVLGALNRCRKELRGRVTLQDVIGRLDDGRPGPEEAWAMLPKDESASVVWTDEMCEAWGVALPLIEDGDTVAGRMAFLERYRGLVMQARDSGKSVHWVPSLGHDAHGREAVLLEAVERGRLSAPHVALLLPYRDEPHPRIVALLEAKQKQLTCEAAA